LRREADGEDARCLYGGPPEACNDRAADIAPTIRALQEDGATSLNAIAAGLNAKGIPTARGAGQWTATQVARVLERMG
jgi:hypothetical protein